MFFPGRSELKFYRLFAKLFSTFAEKKLDV
jgi:hypothetical protein